MAQTKAAQPSEVRADIQALRALAVAMVVLFHLNESWLPGGYVGVDAFFVVSGFLITQHLEREFEARGTVSLASFWARRARRLLPASLLVLLVSLVGLSFFTPLSLWRESLREFGGATGYVANWILALAAVNYSAAEDLASPVQHFWSLSVEEQFYAVWPALLLVGTWLGARVRAGTGRRGRLLVIGLVCLGSLAVSIEWTRVDRASAYFSTFTRAFEFGAGALLALSAREVRGTSQQAAAGWLGLVALLASALVFDGRTSFPGYRALLPVSATVLVLACGNAPHAASVGRRLGFTLVRWLGDLSYGIYLWHWPLIVFFELIALRRPNVGEAVLLVGATLVLAAVTKLFVEDRVRYHPGLTRARPARTFAFALGGMLVVGGATAGLYFHQDRLVHRRIPLQARLEREVVPCFGADARISGRSKCEDEHLRGVLLPRPEAARLDTAKECLANKNDDTLVVCRAGVTTPGAPEVALLGDSHAAHFLPAIDLAAKERGEAVITFVKGSCPFSLARRDGNYLVRTSCTSFNEKVRAELAKRPNIRRVFVSASARNTFLPYGGLDAKASAVSGYVEAWRDLPPQIRDVIVLVDTPLPRKDVVLCLERLHDVDRMLAPGACSRPRSDALLPDPLVEAARRSTRQVHLVDFTEAFCDGATCFPVVGHALVYRDPHHVSRTFARTLGPSLARQLTIADDRLGE